MKRFFYLIIICISFYACKPGIPKSIIQPDKMQDVLFDIHIVDGYIATLSGSDTAKKVGAAFYNGIYKKFDIDSALYNKSINYYYKHPDVMKKMYDSITVKLNKLKEKNQLIVNAALSNFIFKGIFDKNAADTILLDYSLNRKYNYRGLKTNVFINATNSKALVPLNQVPNVQSVPLPQPIDQPVKLTPIAEPVRELPKPQP